MSASLTHQPGTVAIRTDLGAIFVSLELSRSKWLITSLSPGSGEKLSRREMAASQVGRLLALFSELKAKAKERMGRDYPVVAIQEAGLDGFWLDRALRAEGIESHVVDPASIAVSRRKRRAKTDRIDGEMLMRTLLAYKRGEPRVCAMVRPPTPEQEDQRRVSRERRTLVTERVEHTNRIKGLLFAQGVIDYEPLLKTRRARLEALTTGDGRPLPEHIKQQIMRELDRLELVMTQIKAVEAERDALLAEAAQAKATSPAACLRRLKGVGEEFAAVLWLEGLYKTFDNRRQLAAYAGLAPSPWKSGKIDHEQGVSKAGNPRLRSSMIQLSWLWLRHQPDQALTLWFQARVRQDRGRVRKVTIVALARKLLVALWKYVTTGLVPPGAQLKPV